MPKSYSGWGRGVLLALAWGCAPEGPEESFDGSESVSSRRQNLTNVPQRLAIPTYFDPGSLWSQLESGVPTVGLSIINPNSGPGAAFDPAYLSQTQHTQARGITVLGYVHTSYGTRPASEVVAEINQYYTWYAVDGIFLDEVPTECSLLPYYTGHYNHIKAKGGKAVVVLNPGTSTSECYMSVSDILLTFESTYTSYRAHVPAAWESRYPPERFWHLVYGTSSSRLSSAISISKSRGAGWIYVTPDKLPNPWDTLPTGTYWTKELSLAAAP